MIAGPEDGDRLKPGEILVTTLTNVGWTPMFPRAAAVCRAFVKAVPTEPSARIPRCRQDRPQWRPPR